MNTCDSFTQRLNLLLIEDDHNDQALFGLAVEKTGLGLWVQTAADGQQAIEYLLGHGIYAERQLHPLPDLMVLDLKMPRADGLDFLAWRAAFAPLARIPVVLFTDSFDQDLLAQARALGAAHHVFKPFEFSAWEAAVRQIWTAAQACGVAVRLPGNRAGSRGALPQASQGLCPGPARW